MPACRRQVGDIVPKRLKCKKLVHGWSCEFCLHLTTTEALVS